MSSQSVAERTLFLGPRIPNYVKLLHKSLQTIKRPVFKQLIKLAVLDFEGQKVSPDMYMSIKKTVENDNCNIDVIYGSLYFLLKCAFSFPENSLKQEIFKEDLHILKIPDEFIEDIVNVVFGPRVYYENSHAQKSYTMKIITPEAKRESISNNFLQVVPKAPKLKQFRWRIDVAISSSTLSRVLEPVIVLEIKLSDDHKEVFEVHPSQFHKLRFAVATLLKEIENVETRNVLKY